MSSRGVGVEEFRVGRFAAGVGIMLLGQILSSFMGLTLEGNFKRYGSTWQESLFWTHALALPCFLPFAVAIRRELPLLGMPLLGLNILTQFLCVVGVNQMAVVSSALSVTVVLNLRKFTSLVLSYGLFGHMLDVGMALGSALVFGGALAYALGHPTDEAKRDRTTHARRQTKEYSKTSSVDLGSHRQLA